MIYSVLFLILIGSAALFVNTVYAAPPFNSQEIYDFSNVIALGKVISVNSTFSSTQNLYEIKVEKFLKNTQDSDIIFATGQNTVNPRLGNSVFSVNDRGLFFLTAYDSAYDRHSGILAVYPTSRLIEPEWDKCNIFEKEIPREHWVFGGTGQVPTIRQGNNTDRENFTVGKEITITYDLFNDSPNVKNTTYGILVKNLDDPDSSYVFTEINTSYLLGPCIPYKTLTWNFAPSKSGHYALEFYDLRGSEIGSGFVVLENNRSGVDHMGSNTMSNSDRFPSPLKQLKSGISTYDIRCNNDLQLVMRNIDNMPACVTPYAAGQLVIRSWAHVHSCSNMITIPAAAQDTFSCFCRPNETLLNGGYVMYKGHSIIATNKTEFVNEYGQHGIAMTFSNPDKDSLKYALIWADCK